MKYLPAALPDFSLGFIFILSFFIILHSMEIHEDRSTY